MEARVMLSILFLLSLLLVQGSDGLGLSTACTHGSPCPKGKRREGHARRVCSIARQLNCEQIMRDEDTHQRGLREEDVVGEMFEK